MKNLKLQFKIKSYQSLFRFLLLFLTVNFSLFILNLGSAAAAGVGLAIQPPLLQITANPPASIVAPITIANTADEPVTLQIVLREFKQSDGKNGTITYVAQDKKPEPDEHIFDKVQIFDGDNQITSFELAPKQEKQLSVHIDIPKDEPLSDYYFSIIFVSNDQTNSSVQTTNSGAAGGIAVNTLLSIGTEQANGSITQFDSPKFLFKGPVPFTLSIHNSSKHVIAPQGVITITNMFGQTIGQMDLVPVNILSDTDRFIPDTRSLTSPASQTTPTILWPETALLGPYTATVRIKLSDSGPLFERSIHFFALPIPAILALIILIIIGVIIRERVKKKLVS